MIRPDTNRFSPLQLISADSSLKTQCCYSRHTGRSPPAQTSTHADQSCFTCFNSSASSTSTSNLSLHPPPLCQLLFLTAGRYELPPLAPGNYGNGFLLDRWRPPSGDFIIIIRYVCMHEHAQVRTLVRQSPSSLLPLLT